MLGVIAVALPTRTRCPARHPSPKKSPGARTATTASLPSLGEHRELHRALLHLHDTCRGVALREDHLAPSIGHNFRRDTCRVEKRRRIESGLALGLHRAMVARSARRSLFRSGHRAEFAGASRTGHPTGHRRPDRLRRSGSPVAASAPSQRDAGTDERAIVPSVWIVPSEHCLSRCPCSRTSGDRVWR